MNDETFEKYIPRLIALHRKGLSPERAAAVVLADEDTDRIGSVRMTEFKAAECDADPSDRAIVERVLEYGANELGIATPRVRFFRSEGLTLKGFTERHRADEVWVAADAPWSEMGEIALHEVAHLGQLSDDPAVLPDESAELGARRFVDRGRRIGWIQSAARATG